MSGSFKVNRLSEKLLELTEDETAELLGVVWNLLPTERAVQALVAYLNETEDAAALDGLATECARTFEEEDR